MQLTISWAMVAFNVAAWATPHHAVQDPAHQDPLRDPIQQATDPASQCALAAPPDVFLSIGHGFRYAQCAPTTGLLNTHMIFADFRDAPATPQAAQEAYDFFLPAAAHLYTNTSFGALTLHVTTDTPARFHRMPRNTTAYAFNRSLSAEAHYAYIQDAVDAWQRDAVLPSPVHILYIVAPPHARAISFSPTYLAGPVRSRAGTLVARAAVTIGYDAFHAWGWKTLVHETGHCLCLPDMYAVGAAEEEHVYVGGWDLMGLISGRAPDAFAWVKWKLGWLRNENMACVVEKGTYNFSLRAVEVQGENEEAYAAVVVRLSESVALVVERRARLGVDMHMCKEGVLLYIVDTRVESGEGPVRVLDTSLAGSEAQLGKCETEKMGGAPLSEVGDTFTVVKLGISVTVEIVYDDPVGVAGAWGVRVERV
ncbi:hypothetical protein P153DRAFT_191263 [Dothidotthia symphoricarpi CBS 119687]|uniref:M6 metalloprotease n=1 Tax=Dothidotthia symphoricarpi CBS 119687 TaxID=1392245 RepID=A0A6A6AJ38_9PLEO|nr:uncharacterized protein P153DRAFT_191263 [Dothidotthia symphoricarpi CBS 119687]KAF2131243.1 hypothetical protein P153DRAFT_191263 [Dothidotthia symphoricarpi CBS 119687]